MRGGVVRQNQPGEVSRARMLYPEGSREPLKDLSKGVTGSDLRVRRSSLNKLWRAATLYSHSTTTYPTLRNLL